MALTTKGGQKNEAAGLEAGGFFCAHTPEQIQKAKDFIWEHLSGIAQSFWIEVGSLPESERKTRYTKMIMSYLSAEREGEVIGREFAVLSIPETFETPSTAASFAV